MRALFGLFGWQAAERKAVTASKLDRVLRHVGNLRYEDWTNADALSSDTSER